MTERGSEGEWRYWNTIQKTSKIFLFVVWYSEKEEVEYTEEEEEENTEEEEEASNLMNGLMMVMRALMYQLGWTT